MSNKGSGFVKYAVTAVACCIMLAVAFSFLIFSTDVLVNVDVSEVEQAQMLYDRTSVSTVVDIIEDSGSMIGDQIVQIPPTPPTPPKEEEAENFIDFCLAIDFQKYLSEGTESKMNEEKAYACLACYKACLDFGLTPEQSVGLLACACIEGTPCLVQHGMRVNGIKSSASEPLYLKTPELIDAVLRKDYTKYTGAGTAQWTGNRLEEYAKVLQPYVAQYGESADYTKYWEADYDMYSFDFAGSYSTFIGELPTHTSTPESTLVYSFFQYEAGAGNYGGTDVIANYTGDFYTYMVERYPYAQAFYDAFQAYDGVPPAVPR